MGGPPMPPGMGGMPMPPGMGMAPARPRKAPKKPPQPMRNLFWSKIPDRKIDSTIWSDLNDEGVELDETELQRLFTKAAPKPKGGADAKKAKAVKAAPKIINLLEPKRLQNVGIAIARFRMKPVELKTAILQLDTEKLPLDRLSTLLSNVPTAEETAMLRDFDGDFAKLGNVEKYFLELIKVPRLAPRLQAQLYMMKFEATAADVSTLVELELRATVQVRDSPKFRRLLEVVLAVGNYLNGTTSRGAAYGFKLDALKKLGMVKSVDNKQTLMHYVARLAKNRYADEVLGLEEELDALEEAAKYGLPQVQADFNQIKAGMKKVQTQVTAAAKSEDEEDQFVPIMQPFMEEGSKQLDDMQAKYDELETEFNSVVESFGDSPKKVGTQELFGLLHGFVKSFTTALSDLERLRIAEEKRKKREAEEEARQKKKEEAEARAAASGGGAAGRGSGRAAGGAEEGKGEEGESELSGSMVGKPKNLVDDVFGSLKKGSASAIMAEFKKRREGQQSKLASSVAARARSSSRMAAGRDLASLAASKKLLKSSRRSVSRDRSRGSSRNDELSKLFAKKRASSRSRKG
eukprot:PLAT3502.1.p1 GENE.PLAT3502.1~~PLAT3502.1.p1  ORF type:complete len:600 (-),score=318.21 PLAT3502.1:267-1994(-)